MKVHPRIRSFVRKALRISPFYTQFITRMRGAYKPFWLTNAAFASLPVTSKETYISKVDPVELLKHAVVPEITYASSGSSGTPTFWFRNEQTIAQGERIHSLIFRHVFGIHPEEPTLVIVTFSMGLWVAGLFTADACRAMRKTGYQVTVATPGIDRKEALLVLKKMGKAFKHVVIAGYPPFVLDFLREATREESHPHASMFVLTAGDKTSEEWRDEVLSLIEKPGALARVINLYGSADAGSMAFETPLSIAVRRASLQDEALKTRLFGDGEQSGALFQFLPEDVHFEQVDGELLLTKDMPIPLIRYNTHDKGTVFDPGTFTAYTNGGMRNQRSWNHLPFVTVTGRTDVAVTLYALNIYPEHICAGISSSACTGSYRAFTIKQDGAHSERLVVEVEVKEGGESSEVLVEEITSAITDALMRLNIEFRKLVGTIGDAALPLVRLLPQHAFSLEKQSAPKMLLQVHGKKPRISYNVKDSRMEKTALMYFPHRELETASTSAEEEAFEAFEALSVKFNKTWNIPLLDNIQIATGFSKDETGSILDVGCGPGQFSLALLERFQNAQVTGVDISDVALKKAKARAVPRATFIKADVCNKLPFADNTFALIVCKHTAHEFSDFAHALREMMRVLKPGGYLYVEDLRRDMPAAFVAKAQEQMQNPSGANDEERRVSKKMASLQYYSARAAYTPDEVRSIVAAAGFEPVVLGGLAETPDLALSPVRVEEYRSEGINVDQLAIGFQTRYALVLKK